MYPKLGESLVIIKSELNDKWSEMRLSIILLRMLRHLYQIQGFFLYHLRNKYDKSLHLIPSSLVLLIILMHWLHLLFSNLLYKI